MSNIRNLAKKLPGFLGIAAAIGFVWFLIQTIVIGL